jgi:hypothetical protein
LTLPRRRALHLDDRRAQLHINAAAIPERGFEKDTPDIVFLELKGCRQEKLAHLGLDIGLGSRGTAIDESRDKIDKSAG